MNHTDTTAPGGAGGRVVPMSRLHGYKVAEGDPDVRTWSVVGRNGRRIGNVHDLLIDPRAQRVRYLDVEIDRAVLGEPAPETTARSLAGPGVAPAGEAAVGTPVLGSGLTGAMPAAPLTLPAGPLAGQVNPPTATDVRESHSGEHVLIPVGAARVHEKEDAVHVDALSADEAPALPRYDGGELTREDEVRLCRRFESGYEDRPESDFYGHDLFRESRFYGGRRLDTNRLSGRSDEDARRANRLTGEEEDRLTGHDRSGSSRINDDLGVGDREESALPIRGRR